MQVVLVFPAGSRHHQMTVDCKHKESPSRTEATGGKFIRQFGSMFDSVLLLPLVNRRSAPSIVSVSVVVIATRFSATVVVFLQTNT